MKAYISLIQLVYKVHLYAAFRLTCLTTSLCLLFLKGHILSKHTFSPHIKNIQNMLPMCYAGQDNFYFQTILT